ncbi:MAG TPA: SusC/RagA family TonB-linked outer membrane protein [Bacteroidales bacterium]|nr:SusC/RagA family TonB-linked outer membrane protein [Bacteroidales bacterium]
MKKFFTIFGLLLFLGLSAHGQERLVTGTVVNLADGTLLPGVTITVKGTPRGVITDIQGRYQIAALPGETLVFSFIGMVTREITLDNRVMVNMELEPDIAVLDEIVVTALGISRESKALGFSVTEVSANQIAQTGEINPISSLAGKVAGLDITQTTAGPSGSRRVVIRGINEIMGNNQPLYVIDGVPVENSTLGQATEWGGFDLGDGTSDLNPEDIESISVLKGAAAAALYGSRAMNGVILITTKRGDRGRPGLGIEMNSSTTWDVVSTRLDEYQNFFGQGSNGLLPMHGQMANNITSAWGPRLNPDSTILQRDGVRRPFTLVENNIKDFFNVGTTLHNTVSLTQVSENSSLRFSFGNVYNSDIIPGSGLVRNNLTLRGTSNVANIIEFDSRISFSTERVDNRPALTDDVNNIGNGLVGLAPNFDQAWLQTYADELGNYIDYTGNPYRANPYWTINQTSNESSRNRITGFVAATVNLHPMLRLRLRSGLDQFSFDFFNFYNRNTPTRHGGFLAENQFNVMEMNNEALLIFENRFADVLDVTASFGGNMMRSQTEVLTSLGTEILAPGVVSIINFQNVTATPDLFRKKIHSLYGFLQLGYRGFLYLDFAGRNDWSSTLPVANNSYFYPSISGSFIPTEAFDFNLPWLTFAKLRASWAQVGSDTDPHKLDLTYSLAGRTHLGFPLGGISGTLLPNPHLKPQTATSYEFGADFRFFNNRVGIDFTYFNQLTTDQIIEVQVPEASGFERAILNSGDMRNSGIELMLRARPIDRELRWDISLNYARTTNVVERLADEVDALTIADARWAGVRVIAREGSEFGIISGRGFQRDPNGNIIHGSNGLPLFTPEPIDLGSILPDWIGGLHNTFSYRGVSVRTSIDFRMGGNIYSLTNRAMYIGGTHSATLPGRDGFIDWANRNQAAYLAFINAGGIPASFVPLPLDGGHVGVGVVQTGVDLNGNPIFAPNTRIVNPQEYWNRAVSDVGELNVYDASYIKLRDISIGYTIPRRLLGNLPVQSVTISAIGRNLFVLYKNVPNIDPESTYNNSNGQGLEYGSLPTRRHFGFNLNVKF